MAFCGAGGSSLGARAALPDAHVTGIDSDPDACATHRSAGFETLQADMTYLSPRLYGPVNGMWQSPPCPAWSKAGGGAGNKRLAEVLGYLHRWRIADGVKWRGDDPAVWLVTEPLRWALTLMPEWLVCEQVPSVLPIWHGIADRLRACGYWAWAGKLDAADYGVPQTRERAFLLASRTRRVGPPAPTHAEHPHPCLDGTDELPWVTMAEALQWDAGSLVESHGTACHSPYFDPDARPSRTVMAERAPRRFLNRERPGERPLLVAAGRQGARERSLATRHYGHVGADGPMGNDVTMVTLEERAILQGFPANHPFQGNESSRARQIGNAVPPAIAEACIRAVAGDYARTKVP